MNMEENEIIKTSYDIISMFSGKDKNELYCLYLEIGVFETLKKFFNANKLTENINKTEKYNPINTNINNEIQIKIQEIECNIDSLNNKMETYNNVKEVFEKGISFAERALEFAIKNQENINIVISATTLRSPVLAYRGLLYTYSKAMFPQTVDSNINIAKYNNMLRQKIYYIGRFNRVAFPFLGGNYLFMHNYYKAFTPLTNSLISSRTASSSSILMFILPEKKGPFSLAPFLSLKNQMPLAQGQRQNKNNQKNKNMNFNKNKNKNNNMNLNNNKNNKFYKKFKSIYIKILGIIIIGTLFLSIKYFRPSIFENLIKFIPSDPYWIKISLYYWLLGWCLIYILEFFIYVFYIFDNKTISIPNYLPSCGPLARGLCK